MVFKPRNRRLSPDKVKANLIAQQVRLVQQAKLGSPRISKKAKRIAQQAFPDAATEISAKLQLAMQAAAEINPIYRSFVDDDWKETFKRFNEYSKTLPEAQRKELLGQFFQDCGLSWEDFLPVIGLALLGYGELGQEAEPSSAS